MTPPAVPLYAHTQIGYVILGVTAAVAMFIAAVAGPEERGAFWPILAVLAVIVGLFPALTVKIDTETMSVRFGVGPLSRRFPLAEIASAQRTRNPWYAGWGIRRGRGYWLFNVSGFDAVELVMRNGKKYRIGTDEPEALAEAIRRALASRGRA